MLKILALLFVCVFLQQTIVSNAIDIQYDIDADNIDKFYVTHEAWFNISIKENKVSSSPIKTGRIVIGLFGEICPMTVTNFISITKGLRRGTVTNEY